MDVLLVLENPKAWDLEVPDVDLVSARDYLVDPRHSGRRRTRVFNLCRTYSPKTAGYYVSLLAEARGHRPLPSVATIQDLRSPSLARMVSEELDEQIQQTLRPLRSDRFTLSIYFGRNLAARYDRLSKALLNLFPAPLLRAEFVRSAKDWPGGHRHR